LVIDGGALRMPASSTVTHGRDFTTRTATFQVVPGIPWWFREISRSDWFRRFTGLQVYKGVRDTPYFCIAVFLHS
jgi:hypothetical protein